jgi:hypothetical protein
VLLFTGGKYKEEEEEDDTYMYKEKSVKYFDTFTTFFCTMDISNFQKDATITLNIA